MQRPLYGHCFPSSCWSPQMRWRQAPLQIEGRRYFNVSRPRLAVGGNVAAAASAALKKAAEEAAS
ncbi:translation elongation factor G [Apiospora arundinis]